MFTSTCIGVYEIVYLDSEIIKSKKFFDINRGRFDLKSKFLFYICVTEYPSGTALIARLIFLNTYITLLFLSGIQFFT